jgi:hypothetical protein
MKSEMKDKKNIVPSYGNPHQHTLGQAILRTLLLVWLLKEAIAEESSKPPLVSFAFDGEAKHLIVASCYEGFG